MAFFDMLRGLHDELVQLVLEPERVEAWLEHLRSCGLSAELDWRPESLKDARFGRRMCIGRICLADAPVDYVRLLVCSSPQKYGTSRTVRQVIRHEVRFCIRAPGLVAGADVRAKRKPVRRFWIGPKTGEYRWHGGALAQQLAQDTTLNQELTESDAGRITVGHNERENLLYVGRKYVGARTRAVRTFRRSGPSPVGGVFGSLMDHAGIHGEIDRDYQLPTQALLNGYFRIAQHVRRYVGLTDA